MKAAPYLFTSQRFFCILAVFFYSFGFWGESANAGMTTPLFTRNQSPFIRIFGLPITESGALLDTGDFVGRLLVDIANNMTVSKEGNENIVLDGESVITVCNMRYGFKEGVEVGLDVPYIVHERGALDHFIDDWHDFFGLPEGERDDRPRKLLEYRYEKDGRLLHLQDGSSKGIGDIQLSIATQLFFSHLQKGQKVALRAALKIPTGQASKLHGSGGTDFSLRLCAIDTTTLSSLGLTYWGMTGILLLGDGEVLEEIRRDFAGFASFGIGWQVVEWLELKLQLDSHTRIYKSSLSELGAGSLQLSMGGTFRLAENIDIDLGVSEDIAVDTAPDVVFHLALKRLF